MEKITEKTVGKDFFNWLKRVWLIRNVDGGKTIISRILPEEETTEESIYLYVDQSLYKQWWYVDINSITWQTINDLPSLSFTMKHLEEVVSNRILEKLKKSCFFTRNMGMLNAGQVIFGKQEKLPDDLIMFYIDDYIIDKNMLLLEAEDFIWSESDKPLPEPIFIIDPTSTAFKQMKESEWVEYEDEDKNVNDWNIIFYRYYDYGFPIQEFLDAAIGKREVKKYVEKSKLNNTYFLAFGKIYPANPAVENIQKENIFLFNLHTKAPVKEIIRKKEHRSTIFGIDGEEVLEIDLPPELKDYISEIAIDN